MRACRAVALVMGLAVLPAPVWAQRLVMLPVENLGSAHQMAAEMAGLMGLAIRARGWELVAGESVEAALARLRIRRLDSLSAASRQELQQTLRAEGYVTATILALRSENVPLAAAALRMVAADGEEIFSEVVGLTAEDTRGVLDQTPVMNLRELSRVVVDRLFEDFPQAGEPIVARASPKSPGRLPAPATFRSAALDEVPSPRRVTVLPLKDWTYEPGAARIAGALAARWLSRSELFEPVEPADLRAALIAERIRDPRQIDPRRLAAIGGRVGSTLFLTGAVYRWQRAGPSSAEVLPPEVDIRLTLIDSTTQRVLWSSQHRRLGDDYRGLFGLGTITNVVALSDRTLGEMVTALETARPVPIPDPSVALTQRIAWRRAGQRP